MRTPLLSALLFVAGCEAPPQGDALAIGDSYFDWNEGADIPDVAGEELGLEVANEAIAGAKLTGRDDIRSQYAEGRWQFLLMNGGGNDMRDECDCTACGEDLDDLIAADGTRGDLVEYANEVASADVPVFYFFYPELPPGTEFAPCIDVLLTLRDRVALAAEDRESLTLIDGGDVVRPDQGSMYDEDNVHPSEEGSRVLGAHAASVIGTTLSL